MTSNSDDERLLIQRIQRDRIAFGLAIGVMALGAAMSVVGLVGVFVDGLGESGFGRWPALAAVGSFITLGAGYLLIFYMRKTPPPFARRDDAADVEDSQQSGQRARSKNLVHRVGKAFMTVASVMAIAACTGFFARVVITGDSTDVWSWVPALMVVAVPVMIAGGVLRNLGD
ncbi:hypothetical protein [Saccharothrix syringae]|uniref:Uncharacterized protein n=1 Tax=Saccharothrix syringae TaxID=103733 RepID=A0A5Q0GYL9_SACSY|nr:hypothetical protein [Saccharothrix syringae]QFZ18755.1 hypothetical protein EKG83_16010 [Saccharothrix syringae]